jgi:hypothetical protein
MVSNVTFNNISTISWRPVLVVEEADHGQAIGKPFSKISLVLIYCCLAPNLAILQLYCGVNKFYISSRHLHDP